MMCPRNWGPASLHCLRFASGRSANAPLRVPTQSVSPMGGSIDSIGRGCQRTGVKRVASSSIAPREERARDEHAAMKAPQDGAAERHRIGRGDEQQDEDVLADAVERARGLRLALIDHLEPVAGDEPRELLRL